MDQVTHNRMVCCGKPETHVTGHPRPGIRWRGRAMARRVTACTPAEGGQRIPSEECQ